MIAPHRLYVALSISDNDIRSAFDEKAKSMGIECEKSEEAMEQHQNHPAAERREKSCGAINGAGKDCGKNDKQDGVERSFPRKRAFVSKPHGGECDKKNNDSMQRNLNEGQISRFHTEAQQGFKRI